MAFVSRQKFLFEMLPGYHTQNFVSEIYRLTENVSKQSPETNSTAFDWLDKYKSSGEFSQFIEEELQNMIPIYGFPYHTNVAAPYHRHNTDNTECLFSVMIFSVRMF